MGARISITNRLILTRNSHEDFIFEFRIKKRIKTSC